VYDIGYIVGSGLEARAFFFTWSSVSLFLVLLSTGSLPVVCLAPLEKTGLDILSARPRLDLANSVHVVDPGIRCHHDQFYACLSVLKCCSVSSED